MKKVLLLIAVYKRIDITEKCYKWLSEKMLPWFAAHSVEVQPLIIYSEEQHKKLAEKFCFDYIFADNAPLGRKMNIGLRGALTFEWDYLLQLGSDDFISFEGIQAIARALHDGEKWGGFNRLLVGSIDSELIYEVETSQIFGAGRFIHRELVEKACYVAWCYCFAFVRGTNAVYSSGKDYILPIHFIKEKSHRLKMNAVLPRPLLWRDEINEGLDIDSQNQIWKIFPVPPTLLETETPAIFDLKSKTNIHHIEKFQQYPLSPIKSNQIFSIYEGESVIHEFSD